jgi:hypothetical protein
MKVGLSAFLVCNSYLVKAWRLTRYKTNRRSADQPTRKSHHMAVHEPLPRVVLTIAPDGLVTGTGRFSPNGTVQPKPGPAVTHPMPPRRKPFHTSAGIAVWVLP